MKIYLLKKLFQIIHYSDVSEITSFMRRSNRMPAWNKRRHHVDHRENLNWSDIIPSLFGRRDSYYGEAAHKAVCFDFYKELIQTTVSVESLNVRHLAGFSRGSVTSTKPTLIGIGSDVSGFYEGIFKTKLTKQEQFDFLIDDPAYYMGPIEWTEWHDKYDQTGGAGGGAHRTSSIVFLLNHFDMDLFIDVQVRRLNVDLSPLESCQNRYSFYVFNPNSAMRVTMIKPLC